MAAACDCKPVVDDIRDGTGGAHITITREIALRSFNFDSCSFVFEGQESNCDAHKLCQILGHA